jgi:sec-independent protein translocase protein TatA
MGAFSIWHILIVAVVVVLLFGRGKISSIMGDVAHGIRNFREGLKDPNDPRSIPESKRDTAEIKKNEDAKG